MGGLTALVLWCLATSLQESLAWSNPYDYYKIDPAGFWEKPGACTSGRSRELSRELQ